MKNIQLDIPTAEKISFIFLANGYYGIHVDVYGTQLKTTFLQPVTSMELKSNPMQRLGNRLKINGTYLYDESFGWHAGKFNLHLYPHWRPSTK